MIKDLLHNSISINGTFEQLGKLREFIEEYAMEFTNDEILVNNIVIAIDEACTNIIKHSYKSDINKLINISIAHNENNFVIEISDNGNPFNPINYPTPNMTEYFEQLKNGGLGIHLIRKLMDKVEYLPSQTLNGQNKLILTKDLS